MANLETITILLDMDNRGLMTSISGSTRAVRAFERNVDTAGRRLQRMERSVAGTGAKLRDFFVIISQGRNAFHTLWQATGGWITLLVNANAEVERMKVLLEGMSGATSSIDKASAATAQFNQLIELSMSAPFALKELTNSWVKFKAVGLDPANGSLQSLVDAIAAFGGDDQLLHRATVAIQQMAGKGVISMEELRQQLAEAVPSAMGLMARGLNMKMRDMVDAISKGAVQAKPALAALFREFEKTFGGSAARMMETYTGKMARFKTLMFLFAKEIGDAGLFQAAKDSLDDLLIAMDPAVVSRFGQQIGDTLGELVRGLNTAVKVAVEYRREIYEIGKAFLAWRFIAAPVIGFLVTSVGKLQAAMALTTVATATYATTMGMVGTTALGVFARLRLVIAGVGAALKAAFMSNIVGIILSVAAAVAYLVVTHESAIEKVKRLNEEHKKFGDTLDENTISLEKLAAAELREQINKQKGRMIGRGIRPGSEGYEQEKGRLSQLERELANLEAAIGRSETELRERNSSAFVQRYVNLIGAITRDSKAQFQAQHKAVDDYLATTTDDQTTAHLKAVEMRKEIYEQEFIERRNNLVAGTTQLNQAVQIAGARERAAMDEAAKATTAKQREISLKKAADAKQQGADLQATLTELRNSLYQLGLEAQSSIDSLDVTDIINDGDEAVTKSKMTTYLEGLSGKLAKLKEQLEGGVSDDLAKFNAELAAGKFVEADGTGGPTDEQIRLAREYLTELDKGQKKLKDMAAATELYQSAMERANDWQDKVNQDLLLSNDRFRLGSVDGAISKIESFKRAMAGIRSDIIKSGEGLGDFDKQVLEIEGSLKTIAFQDEFVRMRDESNKTKVQLIQNARERFAAEQELNRMLLEQYIQSNQLNAEQSTALRDEYTALAAKQKEVFENNQPIMNLVRNWKDAAGNMEEAGASFLQGFSDQLADTLFDGEQNWEDFAKGVIKQIGKIIIEAYMAQIALRAIGMISGGATGGYTAGSANVGAGNFDALGAGPGAKGYALGGLMGPKGDMPLKMYAKGGVARRPQVSVFGEGDTPEAYVPLPDGRSIPVTMSGNSMGQLPSVSVNVINQSGKDVEAEQQGGIKFDGEGYVLDVVLRGMSRPGGFRDGMRERSR